MWPQACPLQLYIYMEDQEVDDPAALVAELLDDLNVRLGNDPVDLLQLMVQAMRKEPFVEAFAATRNVDQALAVLRDSTDQRR